MRCVDSAVKQNTKKVIDVSKWVSRWAVYLGRFQYDNTFASGKRAIT